MMQWNEFKTEILAIAEKKGCTDAEVVIQENQSMKINVAEETLRSINQSRTGSCSLRLVYNGKLGFAVTEVPDQAELLVQQAMANACVNEKNETVFFPGPQDYQKIKMPSDPWQNYDVAARLEAMFNMEKKALAKDRRIEKSVEIGMETAHTYQLIANTRGLLAENQRDLAFVYAYLLGKDGEERRMGNHLIMGEDSVNVDKCIDIAVQNALGKLGGKPVPTGSYDIILDGYMMGALLIVFSSVFNAKEVSKGRSLWKDKLSTIVAADCVTLIDNPHLSSNPYIFDDEGIPTIKTEIIKNGRLKTFLHNSSTAAEFNVANTANASRSAGGDIDVEPMNLTLVAGDIDEVTMRKKIGTGLIIDSLDGLHAGVNVISGDFSLLAEGHYFVDGEIVHPVNQITLAGNFFTLLKNIQTLANKQFSLGLGMPIAPSVHVGKMQIAGV